MWQMAGQLAISLVEGEVLGPLDKPRLCPKAPLLQAGRNLPHLG